MSSKKNVAAKSAKKAQASKRPLASQAAKPAKVATPKKGESRTFTKGGVIFEVTAIIPTQQYGNIQPRIQVVCDTIEEGRSMVMPVIEDLYGTYAEEPLSGRTPKFLGKVTETVKTVAPVAPVATQPAPTAAPQPQTPPQPQATASAAPVAPTAPQAPKPESVMKAEKAISLAASADAALAIQAQIEKSVKIPPEFKPDLITLVLEKRSSFK